MPDLNPSNETANAGVWLKTPITAVDRPGWHAMIVSSNANEIINLLGNIFYIPS